jgi:hypothetical protein
LDRTDPLSATQNLKPKNLELITCNQFGHDRPAAAVPLIKPGGYGFVENDAAPSEKLFVLIAHTISE